jgi:hypothetical protein
LVQVGTKVTSAFEVDPPLGLPTDGRSLVFVLIRTPKTPVDDQGSVVEIEGTVIELSGEQRQYVRRAKTIVPLNAAKSANP